jgi:uncharacterized repeat protein (TIGR03843 family)
MAIAADEGALELLACGRIEVQGRIVGASNATLYAGISLDGVDGACVYKPVAGERRLWDFPDGTLAGREVAAYLVSSASGWDLVPPTVYRDGPFGPGSVQLWIDQDDEDLGAGVVDVVAREAVPPGWLVVLDAEDGRGAPVSLVHADSPDLARMAALDVVLNNADRKGGHILPTTSGQVYGVDHGVTFNITDKLRTVLWQWAGRMLPDDAVDVLRSLRRDLDGRLGAQLGELLTGAEVRRTRARIDRLLASRRHPEPSDEWPAIPWPPM